MAKFNIEVELDWMDEEAYSIDDELRERIVKGVGVQGGPVPLPGQSNPGRDRIRF